MAADGAGSRVGSRQIDPRAVAIPPLPYLLGPRVEHVLVQEAGRLSEVVADRFGLEKEMVLELIRFGAVHYAPVHPKPSSQLVGRLPQGHLDRVTALRDEAIGRLGRDPRLQVPLRLREDVEEVLPGAYIRCHLHPKRFPQVYKVDWQQRIVAQSADWVVVDKPWGVQVVPTVDNVQESLMACAARALGREEPLMNAHRLDYGTEGLVVLATSGDFVRWFHQLLRDPDARGLRKMYRALTPHPPPLGRQVHWAGTGTRQYGQPAHTLIYDCPADGLARCELVIHSAEAVQLSAEAASIWSCERHAFECEIELITGRTHQIRAQLSHLGTPLLGDHLYASLHTRPSEPPGAAHQHAVAPTTSENTPRESASCLSPTSAASQALPDPAAPRRLARDSGPLGLQAFRLEVLAKDCRMGVSPAVFEAGPPWWRESLSTTCAAP